MIIILLLIGVILIATYGIARNAISYVGAALILLAAIAIFLVAGGTNAKIYWVYERN